MKKLKLHYSRMQTPWGVIFLGRTERGLRLVAFNKSEWLRQLKSLRKKHELILLSDETSFRTIKSQLKRYFSGQQVNFDQNLDLDGSTSFQKRVWKEMSKI